MSFKRGDIVQSATWGAIVLFEVIGFLPPPKWKPDQDVRLRVLWKTPGRDQLPSWPIGTKTVTCVTTLREPDNGMLVVALAACRR